jgi:hypothetical protein
MPMIEHQSLTLAGVEVARAVLDFDPGFLATTPPPD